MKRSEERTRQAKRRIFEQIDALLDSYEMTQITFGKIAKCLGCQPNSIAYYFENKMDMLLQFTQDYIVTADTELLPVLREGIDALPPVERFCREIDCLFAVSDHKSKPRLLNNYFLITNAPLRAEFNADLNNKVMLDMQNCRALLESYRQFGILSEERFHDTYTELYFYISVFSTIRIFNVPLCAHDELIHNTLERLKAAFLKDGLYTPQYRSDRQLPDYPYPDMDAAAKRYLQEDSSLPALKLEVFRVILRLLSEDRFDDITFSTLAEYCYCQPSGIAYYFKNKQEMLLQFCIWYSENLSRNVKFPLNYMEGEAWTLRSFCRIIWVLCTVQSFESDRVVFWLNYLVISSSTFDPGFMDYFRFYLHRDYDSLQNCFERFRQEGFLRDGPFPLSELCVFNDGQTILRLYHVPIHDAERLERLTVRRLLRQFLKPEFHEEAFRYLDELREQGPHG